MNEKKGIKKKENSKLIFEISNTYLKFLLLLLEN